MLTRVAVAFRRIRAPLAGREERNIRSLMVQTAFVGIVQGGIVTFLPVFLARLGASTVMVSLLTSLPALVTILSALPSGVIASRWRQLVAPSTRCFLVMRIFYLLAGAAGLLDPRLAPALIVAIWGLSAIPSTLGNTVFYDVVAEAVSPRRRAVVNGARWALLGLALSASVALFGELLDALPMPGNYLLVFAISFVAGMCSTWFYARLEIPDREPDLADGPGRSLGDRAAELLEPLRSRRFVVFSLVTFVMRVGLNLTAGVWSVYLVRDLGASDAWIGWRATVESAAMTVGYYFWGRVVTRFGHARIFVVIMAILGICGPLSALATPATLGLLFVPAVIGGFTSPGIDVTMFEKLLSVMPPDRRPRYVAMNTALANLVIFVVPIAGAAVSERTGIRPVLVAAGVFMYITAALAARWLQGPGHRDLTGFPKPVRSGLGKPVTSDQV